MYIKDLNHYFDHTLLKPEATKAEIATLCREACTYTFFSVCVNSVYVPFAKQQLRESDVKVTAVVGFPLGASATAVKVFEADRSIKDGAAEIDMVMNIGALKDRREEDVRADIMAVTDSCRGKADVKVILETCLLSEEEIIRACRLVKETDARFVKTSTGFSKGGATPEIIKLMRSIAQKDMLIKASGGIRTLEDTLAMIEAGADRIGASASVHIMEEWKKKGR